MTSQFPVYVTVSVFAVLFPAASRAVTVITFEPGKRLIPLALHAVVPAHVPLPPLLFDQVTVFTATLSEAAPPMDRGFIAVV